LTKNQAGDIIFSLYSIEYRIFSKIAMASRLNKMTLELKPIGRSRSLTNDAYQQIRASILTNKLTPGQQLKEEWLAAQLHISATPVREALAKLEREKLVKVIPHRGKFVADITPIDVHDIYEVRRELEGLAIMLAIPNIPSEELEALAQFFLTNGCYRCFKS
jgi:DNA-binding GntR family transcriptional regulator